MHQAKAVQEREALQHLRYKSTVGGTDTRHEHTPVTSVMLHVSKPLCGKVWLAKPAHYNSVDRHTTHGRATPQQALCVYTCMAMRWMRGGVKYGSSPFSRWYFWNSYRLARSSSHTRIRCSCTHKECWLGQARSSVRRTHDVRHTHTAREEFARPRR